MLALRLHPDLALRPHDEPMPVPGPGEVLVAVDAVGLCGSDRHWVMDGSIGDAVLRVPLVLGHEIAGTIAAGPDRGRRVAVDPAIACDTCEPCRQGAANLCLNVRFAGHGPTDGGLRDYMAWPERCVYPVSDRIDPAVAALVEPLSVALLAAELAGTLDGATVGIIGCGPIGLLIVGVARLARATSIVATDPHPHRLEAAGSMGATTLLAATESDRDDNAVLAASSGRGLDVVFEADGGVSAVACAIASARAGGTVVLAGIPSDDRTVIPASVARRKGLTLKLVRRSTPQTFARAIELAESGAIDLQRLVTRRVPLADGDAAFASLIARDGLKVIVEPSRES